MPRSASKEAVESRGKINNLLALLDFDRRQRYKGRSRRPQCLLVGLDEVGRGSFAGPVVAAAVMLPEIEANSALSASLAELNDSKKLAPKQRERLATIIHETAMCAIAQASVQEIDELNILQASLLAMKRALNQLSERLPAHLPVLVLIDGDRTVSNIEPSYVQSTVIKGDSTSASIAAASIIAKVYRDRIMIDLAKLYPVYGWQTNKGYGSALHREALRQYGMTPWHRRLFCENALNREEFTPSSQLDEDLAEPAVCPDF